MREGFGVPRGRGGRASGTLALLALGFTLAATLAGCDGGSDKFKLGLREDEVRVARVAVYQGNVETNQVGAIGVSDHQILKARAINARGDVTRLAEVAMTSTDPEILKVLSTWTDGENYYASILGVKAGTAEILVASQGITTHVIVPVSAAVTSGDYPYIRFDNITTDILLIDNPPYVYSAEVILANGVAQSTPLIFNIVPNNSPIAKITSFTKTSATVKGLTTGEVLLHVRDEANTMSSGVTVRVQ